MTRPLVSVIVTTRNRPILVRRAIESVLGQTWVNREVIVVDDASDDGTTEILRSFSVRGQATVLRHPRRRGLAAARNSGLAISQGELVAFLDDDDWWETDSLEKRVELILAAGQKQRGERPVGVVVSGCRLVLEDQFREVFLRPRLRGPIREAVCSSGLSSLPSTMLIPRSALDTVGGFDETLVSSVDHDILMSLGANDFSALAVDEPLTVTTFARKKRSMVTDTTTRVDGVERFLEKWRTTFQGWFGTVPARRFEKAYRARVIGDLAGRTLASCRPFSAIRAAARVVRKNGVFDRTMPILMKATAAPPVSAIIKPRWLLARISRCRPGRRGGIADA